MAENKDILLGRIREGGQLTLSNQLRLAILLSTPAILAQLASVMLQFIDNSMVGSLGVNPSASIGLVSTTIWVVGGFCSAASSGFSVQVAHLIGANDFKAARAVMRQGLVSVLIFSFLLTLVGLSIADDLPRWLRAAPEIREDSTRYFRTIICFTPFLQLEFFLSGMLQSSGNMKVPSLLNVTMCVLDVIFNFFLIFPTRVVSVFGMELTVPGFGLGVLGAALGTVTAQGIAVSIGLWYLLCRSKELNIKGERGSFMPTSICLRSASTITLPMWMQNIVIRGAHIISTVIVAPLGPIAIAANSFAITVESLCYMPGYGIADAATALVGQSLGAKRKELAGSFANLTVWMGVAVMSFFAVLMFAFAPQLMSVLSRDAEVIALGAKCLRIEAFAEPMFAVSIVGYGVCVGGGDTTMPMIMNLICMWAVRIALALVLTASIGLIGFWIAMCADLIMRGILYILRLRSHRWMKMM